MRSWTPQAPSPKVKARLFGGANPAREIYSSLGETFTLRWLAPSMACLALAMLSLLRPDPRLAALHGGNAAWMLATGSASTSNRTISARMPIRFEIEPSALEVGNFEASRTGTPAASFNLFASLATNNFRH